MKNLLISLHDFFFDPERLPIALTALALTSVVGMMAGPFMGNANPLYWGVLDSLFGRFGAKLDRKQRKMADLVFRGFMLTLLVLGLSYGLGSGAQHIAGRWPYYRITEILCLSILLTSGAVWYAVLKLYFALQDKKTIKGAFYAVSRTGRLDLSASDDFSITRAGMMLTVRTFDKGLVAPVLWYLVAGLPGAFVYAGLAALAWRFGKGFGTIPLALDKLMGFGPSLLAGLLVALAGLFTPTGGMTPALAGLLKAKNQAKYEEGGWPVKAMAYALKVNLGGPAIDLDGSALQREWVGPPDATARLEPSHLRRGLYIIIMAYLLFAVSLGAAMLYGPRWH